MCNNRTSGKTSTHVSLPHINKHNNKYEMNRLIPLYPHNIDLGRVLSVSKYHGSHPYHEKPPTMPTTYCLALQLIILGEIY